MGILSVFPRISWWPDRLTVISSNVPLQAIKFPIIALSWWHLAGGPPAEQAYPTPGLWQLLPSLIPPTHFKLHTGDFNHRCHPLRRSPFQSPVYKDIPDRGLAASFMAFRQHSSYEEPYLPYLPALIRHHTVLGSLAFQFSFKHTGLGGGGLCCPPTKQYMASWLNRSLGNKAELLSLSIMISCWFTY